MVRNVAAVIAGLIAGTVFNIALVQLNTVFFPLPEGTDLSNTAQMREAVKAMPGAAWILVIIAHLGQAFVGGWVAAKLGASHRMLLALIVGVLSLAGGVANAIMLDTPAWTWLEMPLYLVLAWFAGRLVESR